MTLTLAVAGKSGSGKTAFTQAIFAALRSKYRGKSILLIDNSLGCELAHSFGLEIQDTIYSIRTNQCSVFVAPSDDLKKSEYIEYLLHEIIINYQNGDYDEVDILASGAVFTEECTCITAKYIKDAMKKLIKTYEIVIIDCEYDLSYVNQLVNYYPDVTIVLAEPTVASVYSAMKIRDSSFKYASPGQIGVVLNKVRNGKIPEKTRQAMKDYELETLGVLPYDEHWETEHTFTAQDSLVKSAHELLFRLNLPLHGD